MFFFSNFAKIFLIERILQIRNRDGQRWNMSCTCDWRVKSAVVFCGPQASSIPSAGVLVIEVTSTSTSSKQSINDWTIASMAIKVWNWLKKPLIYQKSKTVTLLAPLEIYCRLTTIFHSVEKRNTISVLISFKIIARLMTPGFKRGLTLSEKHCIQS